MATRFLCVGCAVLGFLVGLQALGHAQSTRQRREEALRLCGERNAVGATKLRDAYDQEKQPEVLFDLGKCRERLGQDDEALQTYRSYLKLPLALRITEAKARMAAIEKRQAGQADTDGPTSPPRYVLLPNDSATNACSEKCSTEMSMSRRQCASAPSHRAKVHQPRWLRTDASPRSSPAFPAALALA